MNKTPNSTGLLSLSVVIGQCWVTTTRPSAISPASAPLWSIQITVFDAHFLSCFADVNRPLKWKILTAWWSWAHSPRPPGACCRSVTKSCLTLCEPMDCSVLGFPLLPSLLEFAQTCPLSRWCYLIISSSASGLILAPVTSPSAHQWTVHKLTIHPASLPHLPFKNALLKPLQGVQGFFRALAACLLARPCHKPFSAPNSDVSVFFGLTVHRDHELSLAALSFKKCPHGNVFDGILSFGLFHFSQGCLEYLMWNKCFRFTWGNLIYKK